MPAAAVFGDLVQRYSEPSRAYHTLRHIEECFAQFDRARDLAQAPGEVAVALWFHDAIYDAHESDNEQQSAAWAVAALQTVGAPPAVQANIRALILATQHRGEPASADAALVVDIDLAILGAPAGRFVEYEEQIRQEYVWVETEQFRAARARILRQFAAKPCLYRTEFFRRRLEQQARANLARSLALLQAP
jgi:predicted metal-dependent HD superfamily phosphohydrolase